MRLHVSFALALLTLAAAAPAAENCGHLLRSPSRFRGTIRSITQLSEGAENVNMVDYDALFAVVVDIAGEPVTFAIHSPSRTFGSGKLIGRSFDLEAERMDCDSVFRSYIRLRRPPAKRWVEKFTGALEVGHSYRGKIAMEGDELSLPNVYELPIHHEGEMNYTNLDEFLAQHDPHKLHEIVFEVEALHITMIGERAWLSLYDVKLISGK